MYLEDFTTEIHAADPEPQQLRTAESGSEKQGDDQPAQPARIDGFRSLVATGDEDKILRGDNAFRGGEIVLHGFFTVKHGQPLLHLRTGDQFHRVGFQQAFLHEEAAESAQHAEMQMHSARAQLLPVHQEHFVTADDLRNEGRQQGFLRRRLREKREFPQNVRIDPPRARSEPTRDRNVGKVFLNIVRHVPQPETIPSPPLSLASAHPLLRNCSR